MIMMYNAQLKHVKKKIIPALWKHKDGWPFKKPVDPVKHELPVSF